jgi:alpha/beta superfamily hydrolase
LISIGTPVDKYDYSFLKKCAKPILFVHGDSDEFGSVKHLRELYDSLTCEKEIVIFENCGHFFDQHLNELKEAIRDWTARQIQN